jgi:hypothetical protein
MVWRLWLATGHAGTTRHEWHRLEGSRPPCGMDDEDASLPDVYDGSKARHRQRPAVATMATNEDRAGKMLCPETGHYARLGTMRCQHGSRSRSFVPINANGRSRRMRKSSVTIFFAPDPRFPAKSIVVNTRRSVILERKARPKDTAAYCLDGKGNRRLPRRGNRRFGSRLLVQRTKNSRLERRGSRLRRAY